MTERAKPDAVRLGRQGFVMHVAGKGYVFNSFYETHHSSLRYTDIHGARVWNNGGSAEKFMLRVFPFLTDRKNVSIRKVTVSVEECDE